MKKILPLIFSTSNLINKCYYLIIIFALFIPSSIFSIHRVNASGTVTTCSETALLSAVAGGGVVTFNLAAPCTITLTSTINLGAGTDLTIDGSGQNIVISGNDTVRLFQVSNATLTLHNLELTRGYSPSGYGAALDVIQGSVVTLFQTTLSQNQLGGGLGSYSGGAVGLRSGSSMTVIQSTLTGNQISGASGASAGAIYKDDTSNLTVINSVFSDNRAVSGFVSSAGAIFSENGPMTIVNSQFSNNLVDGTNNAFAGAVYIYLGNPAILNSTFANNTVQNTGTGAAYGGAVVNFIGSPTVIGSTFVGNRATAANQSAEGGAWYNQAGNPTIVNSTFTANSVDGTFGFGGALNVGAGSPLLQNVTIANNQATGTTNSRGGGIFSSSGPAWTLNNSIVANNTATAGQPNCYNTPSGGMVGSTNLIYPTQDQCPALAFPVIADPLLGVLASNGGPTQTMALGAGSPAINNADPNLCSSTDQRGYGRFNTCDIGAYEFQGVADFYAVPTLTKTFDPAMIEVGDNSMLTITLTNANDQDLTYAYFVDDLPSEITIDGTASTTCSPGTVQAFGSTILATGLTIPANNSCEVTVLVTSVVFGTHTNTISEIFATETDTRVLVGVTDDLTVGTQPDPPIGDGDGGPSVTDPGISKVGILQPGQLGLPGETITWTITATASSDANLTNVVISDTFRSELQIDSVTTTAGTASINGQTITVTVPFMATGSSVTIRVTTTVLSNPASGVFTNIATLAADNGVFLSAEATVLGVSGLPNTGYPPGN